jgi:AcrR family transcriptional regulator
MSSPQIPTPQRILTETWRLMEQNRGQGVRIEDIAKAAGVSRQAVYLHFGSRGGLLKATLGYVEDVLRFGERIQPVLRGQGVETLDALVDFMGGFLPDTYGIAKAFLAVREIDPDAAAAWDERMRILYEGCLTTVRCVAREQMLSPDWTLEEAADFVWAMLSIDNWEHLTIERGWTQADYTMRMKRVLKLALVKPD